MHFSTEISDNTLSLVGLFSQEEEEQQMDEWSWSTTLNLVFLIMAMQLTVSPI